MTDSAYNERLMAQLDGARLVRYDSNAGTLLAWFGGHGVHVYDAAGTELDYWTCGDFSQNDASADVVDESMSRHILCIDDVLERAEQEGFEHGVTAGSWLLDGNSSEHAARRLLSGLEDGDPEILDVLPASPLSGEYADGLLPRDVLAWYDLDEQHDAAADVLSAFEAGFSRAVEAEAVRSATALLA